MVREKATFFLHFSMENSKKFFFVQGLFERCYLIASADYQKHLFSLKLMTIEMAQEAWSFGFVVVYERLETFQRRKRHGHKVKKTVGSRDWKDCIAWCSVIGWSKLTRIVNIFFTFMT